MFGTLGGPELFLIFVVALIVFGPRKLPEIGKSLGRMMSEFRRASNDFRSTIESEVEAEKIRDSMRIEAPRAEPSRTAKTKAAAGEPAGAEPKTAAAAGEPAGTEPKTAESGGPAPSPGEPGPSADEAAGAAGRGSEAGSSSDPAPAGEPVPETVSRQPASPNAEQK